MKKLLFLFIISTFQITFAQDNTDVYVFDVAQSYEGMEFLNVQKVSKTVGYNNQPSFSSNEKLLFAGNNNGQSDISEYNLTSKQSKWVNSKTEGGEYSPQKFPTTIDIAAVRLDTDGLQRFYKYNTASGSSTLLFKDLQVAYFAFYNQQTALATVLDGEKMDLVLLDLSKNSADTLFRDAGRGVQKIPKTNSMSYTLVNEEKNLDLYMINMKNNESYFVCELPIGIQDYVWLNDTQLILGSGSSIFLYDTLGEAGWNKVVNLEEFGIKNITRLAISPNSKKLALVAKSN